jgi:DNA/RNA endonuclease YhcR with UshA esterase domain
MTMRTRFGSVGLAIGVAFIGSIAALPARAQTIGPAETKAYVGKPVTVQAAITDVHVAKSGATFIDMGGEFPDNNFVAVIFADDAAKFPDAAALEGKTVTITGTVQMYQGKPEIILKSASQLKTK